MYVNVGSAWTSAGVDGTPPACAAPAITSASNPANIGLPSAGHSARAPVPPENPERRPHDQRQRADVPRAQFRDAVVRHVLPQPVAIDDRFLEEHPRVEERHDDGRLHDPGNGSEAWLSHGSPRCVTNYFNAPRYAPLAPLCTCGTPMHPVHP